MGFYAEGHASPLGPKEAEEICTDMGQIQIGVLPETQRWQDVIGLIAEGGEVSRVAEATTYAWKLAFEKVGNDSGFREAVWLITQLGVAGRSEEPVGELRAVGLELAGAGSVVEVAIALTQAMDQRNGRGSRERSDFGELAQRALAAVVVEHLDGEGRASSVEGIRRAITKLGRETVFAELAKAFFGRFTYECLSYFLSKTLPTQVGEKRRFATTAQLAEFEDALMAHCVEVSEVLGHFNADWFAKALKEGGGKIGRDSAEKFGWCELEKVRNELTARASADAALGKGKDNWPQRAQRRDEPRKGARAAKGRRYREVATESTENSEKGREGI